MNSYWVVLERRNGSWCAISKKDRWANDGVVKDQLADLRAKYPGCLLQYRVKYV